MFKDKKLPKVGQFRVTNVYISLNTLDIKLVPCFLSLPLNDLEQTLKVTKTVCEFLLVIVL